MLHASAHRCPLANTCTRSKERLYQGEVINAYPPWYFPEAQQRAGTLPASADSFLAANIYFKGKKLIHEAVLCNNASKTGQKSAKTRLTSGHTLPQRASILISTQNCTAAAAALDAEWRGHDNLVQEACQAINSRILIAIRDWDVSVTVLVEPDGSL